MQSKPQSKFFTLIAVIAALWIFLILIQGVIKDRQTYQQQAERSIGHSTANAQTLLGPLLKLNCTERFTEPPYKREFQVTLSPQSLDAQLQASTEPRKRGLYSSTVVNTKAVLKARFDMAPAIAAERTPRKEFTVSCAPVLFVGLDDPRGIRQANAKLGDQIYSFKSGTPHHHYKRGLQLGLNTISDPHLAAFDTEVSLEVVSHQKLGFVPTGENTTIQLASNWPHPSFSGQFAPDTRKLDGSRGFSAQWRVSNATADSGRKISQSKNICPASYVVPEELPSHSSPTDECIETIQVAFIEPINFYSLSDRASKYGLLFVALTFVAVGLFEVMKKLRVHPVQYLLVGAAICTFFLLLLAFSEHIGFAHAYAAGAAATTLLLMFYARFMLGGWLRGLPFGSLIALLYGMLYALLQLEQTALAIGAVALFAVLATVMVLTRKVDWYEQLSSAPATTEETLKAQPAPASFAAAQRGA